MIKIMNGIFMSYDQPEEIRLTVEDISQSARRVLWYFRMKFFLPNVCVCFERLEDCVGYYDEPAMMVHLDPTRRCDPRRSSFRNLTEVIAHEMVHADQYATGRLRQSPVTNAYYWLGKRPVGNREPWETEAYGWQGRLAEECEGVLSK